MKIIDNEIGENGYNNLYLMLFARLSRILVNNGFGDIKVKIGEVEISCVKSILMNGNATLRKLIEDEKMGEVLELYEKCELNSFLEIEKFYSGGTMELNEDNISDILRFSVYYDDNRLMLICKKYIKSHLNESMIGEIFSILNMMNVNRLSDIRNICKDYLKMNGYKYLKNDSLLYKLNLNSLKLILNSNELIMKNESWLLNRLMLWYVKVLKSESENEVSEEELNEFIMLIKTKIHLNEIKKGELSEECMKELKELHISIDDYMNNHIYLNIEEIENEALIKIIQKYYINEEEMNEMKLTENEMAMLRIEKVKIELILLLYKEDIKLIEIVLNIIIEMKISEIIPKEIKNRLLGKLLHEYSKSNKNITLKCFCIYVDSKRNIMIIEGLCGKKTIYQILNEEYYLNSKSKELLIKYIQEMKLSEKEEEEMSKILLNKVVLNELETKAIRFFSYSQSEYSFLVNEEISIIPSLDGNRCEFSITPSLPSGMLIDKESGRIHGKVDRMYEKKEYEVKCKNIKNEKIFKISLEFVIKFTQLNKSEIISISNNGKVIKRQEFILFGWDSCHCYLNLKMENGIYHIKYQFHQNGSSKNAIMLGLSTNDTYSGNCIYNHSTTCNYHAWSGESQDITPYCHIGKVVNSNPNFNNHGDGSIYEIIVNMNKREFWISHNNSKPVLLVKKLPSPLYPYACLQDAKASIDLLSVSHHK